MGFSEYLYFNRIPNISLYSDTTNTPDELLNVSFSFPLFFLAIPWSELSLVSK